MALKTSQKLSISIYRHVNISILTYFTYIYICINKNYLYFSLWKKDLAVLSHMNRNEENHEITNVSYVCFLMHGKIH